jgi:hypothetical protein
MAYKRIDKLDLAIQYLKRAYQIRVEQLGPTHGDTGNAAHALCWTYCKQGRLDDAYKIWTEQIEHLQRANGEGSGRDLLYMFNIGYVYMAMDQDAKAETQFKKVMELCERSQSAYRHYAMRCSGSLLGRIYNTQGRHPEAENILSKVLPIFQEKSGLDDKRNHTLQCISALSKAYEAQGKYEKAEQLWGSTFETAHKTLGDQHEITIRAKTKLDGILTHLNQFKQAE